MRYSRMSPFGSCGGCQCRVKRVKSSSFGFPVRSVGTPGP